MTNPQSQAQRSLPRSARSQQVRKLAQAFARRFQGLWPMPRRRLRQWIRKCLARQHADPDILKRSLKTGMKAAAICSLLLGLPQTKGQTPQYFPLTGTFHPLNGVDVGFASAPRFVDIDGDGD